MKLSKIAYLFLLYIACFALLSACGQQAGSPSSPGGHIPTPAISPTVDTLKSTPTTTLSADCPQPGTAHAIDQLTDTSAVQPAIFYLTSSGGVQTGLHPLDLIRYDLATAKPSTLLSFTSTSVGTMPQIQLSPNKHWLLIANSKTLNTTTTSSVQLMRTDGTQIRTLCSSSTFILSANWLPDGQQVAITKTQPNQAQNGASSIVEVLNLATGAERTVLSGNYTPYRWLDDHRLIVGSNTTTTAAFYLFDSNNGSDQKLADLMHIASFPVWGNLAFGGIAINSDSAQLFTSSFTNANANTNPDNCQGATGAGPSTLNSFSMSDRSTHAIYSSKTLAILAVHPLSTQALLIYIGNNTGDLSQNGLWKINTDGTDLTRLTTAHSQKCQDLNYSQYSPQIASNTQSYALVLTDPTTLLQSIVVAPLSGGIPTTIITSATIARPTGSDGFLQLIGMA